MESRAGSLPRRCQSKIWMGASLGQLGYRAISQSKNKLKNAKPGDVPPLKRSCYSESLSPKWLTCQPPSSGSWKESTMRWNSTDFGSFSIILNGTPWIVHLGQIRKVQKRTTGAFGSPLESGLLSRLYLKRLTGYTSLGIMISKIIFQRDMKCMASRITQRWQFGPAKNQLQ